ncbi:hypothetical protein HDK64DRAFT_98000 [Phyllosticta capitalensis]
MHRWKCTPNLILLDWLFSIPLIIFSAAHWVTNEIANSERPRAEAVGEHSSSRCFECKNPQVLWGAGGGEQPSATCRAWTYNAPISFDTRCGRL